MSKYFFISHRNLKFLNISQTRTLRRHKKSSQYCFCFPLNYRLSKLLSPLGRKKGLFLHSCWDLTQGSIKWKGSDLFAALSLYCVLVKHDGKFIKMPRTNLKPETVFSRHSNRNFCVCTLKPDNPACWRKLETYHDFCPVIPWRPQMTSKFYLLAKNSILNGCFVGESKRGSGFLR